MFDWADKINIESELEKKWMYTTQDMGSYVTMEGTLNFLQPQMKNSHPYLEKCS